MDRIEITKDNINDYYKRINELIDDYFKWNVSAKKLSTYFKNESKLKSFISTNKLDNIKGIERVITDVIEDRSNIERDKKVKKFESFSTANSIDKDDISIVMYKPNEILIHDSSNTKILADFFDTSVDHVIWSNDKYEVDTLTGEFECLIFNEEDMSELRENICDYIIDNIKSKDIVIGNSGIRVSMDTILTPDVRKVTMSSVSVKVIKHSLGIIYKGYEIEHYQENIVAYKKK